MCEYSYHQTTSLSGLNNCSYSIVSTKEFNVEVCGFPVKEVCQDSETLIKLLCYLIRCSVNGNLPLGNQLRAPTQHKEVKAFPDGI